MLVQKKLNKILVPLDGSKNSFRGLKFALEIAQQSGSSIIGLNIKSYPLFEEKLSILEKKNAQRSKEIIKKATRLSEKTNVQFTGVIQEGNNIGKTILSFAHNHKVNLIITGSRGPDPEYELFLGSVANYLVNKSKIPVTIVK